MLIRQSPKDIKKPPRRGEEAKLSGCIYHYTLLIKNVLSG
jgi:hypothetical protein